jgi:Uma2 family endonuclease
MMEESMSTTSVLRSPSSVPAAVVPILYRLSIEQYEAMAVAEILTELDKVELIDGFLVNRTAMEPAHSIAARTAAKALAGLLPDGYFVARESPIRIAPASEPKPDAAVVRGRSREYATRHPESTQVALLVEVADSCPNLDRTEKQRIYATGGIPVYWIINLIDRRLEVYSQPASGMYQSVRSISATEKVAVVVDGRGVGEIAAADLFS